MADGTGDALPLFDREPAAGDLCAAAARGLSAPRKRLPSKFFYDERGSRLFEEICGLEEYYLTRTETGILRECAPEIAALAGAGVRLVELGSGSSTKTRIVLDHLERPAAYVPVDISRAQLVEAATAIARAYPGLPVLPVCADYSESLWLPPADGAPTLAFFPGSTLGNFEPDEAVGFLRQVGAACGEGSGLLLGVDLKKDPAVLERAYDDAAGVTAAFNLNLLERLRRECGAELRIEDFRHRALYDPERGRIEMHLVSARDQTVRLPEGGGVLEVPLRAGEAIVTEHSYKYAPEEIDALAGGAGYRVRARWADGKGWFAVLYLEYAGGGAG